MARIKDRLTEVENALAGLLARPGNAGPPGPAGPAGPPGPGVNMPGFAQQFIAAATSAPNAIKALGLTEKPDLLAGKTIGDVLRWDGTKWVPATITDVITTEP